jgi:hypothetical protein
MHTDSVVIDANDSDRVNLGIARLFIRRYQSYQPQAFVLKRVRGIRRIKVH